MFLAPEVFLETPTPRQPEGEETLAVPTSPNADLWSLGVILLQLAAVSQQTNLFPSRYLILSITSRFLSVAYLLWDSVNK